ncbi:hypothetical protein HDU91_006717 [Kappamyces sp. JEL0680]|nr:hypothetical protein HDU91_006717 [Kappamyces sp. JEL0680]
MTQKHSISSPKKFPSKNSTRPTTPVARSETVEDLIQSDEVVSKEDVFKTRTRVIDDRSPAKPGAEAIQRDHSRIPQAREKPSAAAKKDARFLDTLYERARRITTQLDGRDQVFSAAKPTPALEQWGHRSLQEPVAKPTARPAWPDGPSADAPMLVKELSAFTSATYSGPDAAGLLRPSVETTTALQSNGTRAGSSLNGAARSLHLSATRKTQPPAISSAPLSTMTTAQEKEVIEQVALLLQDEMLKSTSEVFMLPEIEAKYLEQFRVDSEKLTMLGDKVDLLSKKELLVNQNSLQTLVLQQQAEIIELKKKEQEQAAMLSALRSDIDLLQKSNFESQVLETTTQSVSRLVSDRRAKMSK